MILSKVQCLYVYALLYGGVIGALFFRALVRRNLLKDYAKLQKEGLADEHANILLNILFAIPRQIQALRELKNIIATTPDYIQQRYKRFQILNWCAIVLLVLLVIFSFVAHKICG